MVKHDFCRKCGKDYQYTTDGTKSSNGALHRFTLDGHKFFGRKCYPCILKIQAERRASETNKTTRKYEKTENGFLMRLYRNMKSRVTGVQSVKHHLYAGKSLLSKDEFYAWAKSDPAFKTLFINWEASGYAQSLTPSVDRVDSNRGYEMGNMEWVTHGENSRRGTLSRFKKEKTSA